MSITFDDEATIVKTIVEKAHKVLYGINFVLDEVDIRNCMHWRMHPKTFDMLRRQNLYRSVIQNTEYGGFTMFGVPMVVDSSLLALLDLRLVIDVR